MKIFKKIILTVVMVSMLGLTVQAGAPPAGTKAILDIICRILQAIRFVLATAGTGLVALMIIYGGVRYTFSADDPGGRKQGKNIVIHAIIGGILIMVAGAIIQMVVNGPILC